MPNLGANLTWLFTELPFPERFAAAAAAGFRAVEMLFPYELPPDDVADRLRRHRLELALFNLPPGDWDLGERGLAALPGREAEFAASVDTALAYARASGCRRLHAMAGRLPAGADREIYERTYVENLARAARVCAPFDVMLLVEPLNPVENPDYFLHRTSEAVAVIERVGEPNVALQLDLYHTQITEGDLERHIRRLFGRFAHVQIAGNPHRNEPDAGEVDYAYVLGVLDDVGYDGWVGCEYRPRAGTVDGLSWARTYLNA